MHLSVFVYYVCEIKMKTATRRWEMEIGIGNIKLMLNVFQWIIVLCCIIDKLSIKAWIYYFHIHVQRECRNKIAVGVEKVRLFYSWRGSFIYNSCKTNVTVYSCIYCLFLVLTGHAISFFHFNCFSLMNNCDMQEKVISSSPWIMWINMLYILNDWQLNSKVISELPLSRDFLAHPRQVNKAPKSGE